MSLDSLIQNSFLNLISSPYLFRVLHSQLFNLAIILFFPQLVIILSIYPTCMSHLLLILIQLIILICLKVSLLKSQLHRSLLLHFLLRHLLLVIIPLISLVSQPHYSNLTCLRSSSCFYVFIPPHIVLVSHIIVNTHSMTIRAKVGFTQLILEPN